MILSLKILFLFLVAVVVASGCAPREMAVTKAGVIAEPLAAPMLESVTLTNNQIFLWKQSTSLDEENVAYGVVSRSARIDEIAVEQKPLGKRDKVLSDAVKVLRDERLALGREIRALAAKIETKNQEISAKDKEAADLDVKLKEEEGKPDPDQDKIAALKVQIETALKAKSDLSAEVTELAAKRVQLSERVEATKTEEAPIKVQLDEVKAREAALDTEGNTLLTEIMEKVDWYSQDFFKIKLQLRFKEKKSPSGETLFLPTGEPILLPEVDQLVLSGWDLGDGEGGKTFVTAVGVVDDSGEQQNKVNGLIGDVHYTELGGILKFKVEVWKKGTHDVSETFEFRVSRTKYDARDNGIFFTGEVTWKRGGAVRKGVAKFSNQNN